MSKRFPSALVAMVLLMALPGRAPATGWNPLDPPFIESMDVVQLAQMMYFDPSFEDNLVESFYFTGPEGRQMVMQRWKAAMLNAESPEQKAGLKRTLDRFKQMPLAQFRYYRLKGVTEAQVDDFAKKNGLYLHVFRESSFLKLGFGTSYHVLVSGPLGGMDQMAQHFGNKMVLSEDVQELRVELKYKIGAGGWTDFIIPQGESRARDLGYLDAWHAAGILHTLKVKVEDGIRQLIDRKIITITQGPVKKEDISGVKFEIYLPDGEKPFWSN